jgi:hypothetical protein
VSRRGPEREHVVAELGGLLTIAARWRHSRRTLVETNVLAGERGQYRLMQPAQAIQLPATVQVMPPARIDRLARKDKRLLQVASVVGKDVPFTLLRPVAELPHAALRRGLDHLPAAEFVYETGLFPDPDYASGAIWRAIAGMGMTEGVLGGACLRTRLPLQVREHPHAVFHMLRRHHDDFGADAVEFQIDPGVIERQVAYAE